MADDLMEQLRAFEEASSSPLGGNLAAKTRAEIEALRKRIAELEHPTAMDEAIAAGDGMLHGAIDYWQGRAERAEAELAAAREDAERLDWIEKHLFVHQWNGVIDGGSRTMWSIPPSYRHVVARMEGKTFRVAIDTARGKA